MPILAGLYAFLGEELTEEVRERMWLRHRSAAQQRLGIERNGMEVFGIASTQLRERFRFYTERFAVPTAYSL
jgi:hypothetical protein